MNNDIVNNETGLLCYRLRTERQRKRAAKKDFDRQLRRLDKERRELWRKQRNLGWVELKPPVMRGWERYFTLRQDVAESIYAEFFQNILDRINVYWRSNSKDFKPKKKRRKKWVYEDKKQELRTINGKDYKKLTVVEQSYFEEKALKNWQGIEYSEFEFKEPWRFVLKVRPYMVTHTRIRSEEMESREVELDNYFERNHLSKRLDNIKGIKDYWYSEMHEEKLRKERHQYRNLALVKMLDGIKEEQG